jgi:trans-2,3-dihydro-3-hydroxyanthranilate isomerase
MQSLAYEIVDVFTDRAFTGNPLAVVFGADGIATEQMQALAREFHLSETVFVLPGTVPEATYRLRIFTVEQELPFAGHPSVGAAVTQMRRGLIPTGEVVQECGAGLLPVHVSPDGTAKLRGGSPTVSAEMDPVQLLAVAGLDASDFAGPAPRLAGCGLEFPYLSVHPDAVARAVPDATKARAFGIHDISVFAWDTERRVARTRVFFGSSLVEDPATGSAALGFGVWLVASGLVPADGESSYMIAQGVEMLRPSTLACTVVASGGRATEATVSGAVVPVARGEIAVPVLGP